MLGKIVIEIICDSCNKETKNVEVTSLPISKEEKSIILFFDQIPQGWTELFINHEIKYICNNCMKGVLNNE